MSSSRKIFFISACVVLILLCGFGVWWFYTQNGAPARPTTNPYERLTTASPAFVNAEAAFRKGDLPTALGLYKQALAQATDPVQKRAIEYPLAVSEFLTNDYAHAIPDLKTVVAETALPAYVRAYAAQYLAGIAANTTLSPSHDKIMANIVSTPPYSQRSVPGDDALTIRHLFEYASSIYPHATSEINIANWYALDIYTRHLSTTTDPGLSEVNLINQKLASAGNDLARTTGTAYANLIPGALDQKARLLALLAKLGVGSFSDAENAFETSLNLYPIQLTTPGRDWSTRLAYAGFLAEAYGKRSAKQIHSIISPLYSDQKYTHSAGETFLTYLPTQPATSTTILQNNIASVRAVAAIDPGFKNYLMSLGWKNADFSTK